MLFSETEIKTGVNGEYPWGRHVKKEGHLVLQVALFFLHGLTPVEQIVGFAYYLIYLSSVPR
jgi:hypothetical protein